MSQPSPSGAQTYLLGFGWGARRPARVNGLEGLEKLNTDCAPCVILLDLMMPVMDGWQFRAKQLSEPELAQLTVIVLSAVPEIRRDARRDESRWLLKRAIHARPASQHGSTLLLRSLHAQATMSPQTRIIGLIQIRTARWDPLFRPSAQGRLADKDESCRWLLILPIRRVALRPTPCGLARGSRSACRPP